MKARARIKKIGMLWYGQIYGEWTTYLYGILELCTSTGWNNVTKGCLTQDKAMKELKKWKAENYPDEFDI